MKVCEILYTMNDNDSQLLQTQSPADQLLDKHNQAQSEYKHSLTSRVRRYVVTATKPVHRMQIRLNSAQLQGTPIISPSYIRVRVVVWECGEGQTDRHTDGCDQYAFRRGYTSHKM